MKRAKLQLPELWKSTKYISWPGSLVHPIVRVPRPSGKPESKSIRPLPGESEYETFVRCEAYRNRRGVELWGESRWAELLGSATRSVARHREQPVGPITGVYHYTRPHGARVWIAEWHERQPDGTTRQRSKHFSYGTSLSRFATSEEAMAAAVEKRQQEEARWYCTLGRGEGRVANKA